MSSVLDEVLERFEPSPEIVSVMAGTRPAIVLALDVGTSGVRAAMFDEHGREIPGANVQNSRDISTRSGFAEMDRRRRSSLLHKRSMTFLRCLIPTTVALNWSRSPVFGTA